MADKERLPPRARAKIFSMAEQETSLMTAIHVTQAQIKELDEALAMTSEDERKLDLQEMIARRRDVQETQRERHRAIGDLNGKIRRYLDLLPADAVLDDAKPPKIKLKPGQTHQQAIAEFRIKAMNLIAERSQVERCALPVSEIKAQVKKWITERSLRSRPMIEATHEKFTVKFNAYVEDAYAPTLDVAAMLAWFDPKHLEEKLMGLIDQMPKPTLAMTPTEKAERLAAIKVELSDCERFECALVDDALDNAILIAPRPNVSIPALLGIVMTKRKAKAA